MLLLPIAALGTADLIVLVVCALLALRGAIKGFVWQAVRTMGLIGAVVAASAYYEPVGQWLIERIDPIPDEWGSAAGWITIAFAIWLLASFLAHMARGAIRTADLTGTDRVFGFLLGAIMGLVVATVGYSIYGKATSEEDLRATLENSMSARFMGQFVKLVRPAAPDFVRDNWGPVLDAIEDGA